MASLTEHVLLVLLVQVAVLLGAAVLLGRLANRIGLPQIVGELLAGVLLGPSLLGTLAPAVGQWLFPSEPAQQNLLDAIGQIGILLLVGLSAARMDLGFVRRRARVVASVSIGAFVLPLGLGVVIGLAAPAQFLGAGTAPLVFALFTGTVLSVSAIPVIAKTLSEMKLLHRNVGQLTMASGTIDDTLGWILLSVVAAMATVGARAGRIAVTIAALILVLMVTAFLLRPLVRRLLNRVATGAQPGQAIPVATVIVLGCAAATQALHLEAVLGAFLAGVAIGNAHARLLAPLASVVGTVLAPLFLASAGLRVDLGVLAEPVVAVSAVGVLAVAVLAKFAGAFLGGALVRLPAWELVALGAGLNARGAVEIVIAMVGLRLGVLTTASYTVVVFVALATSIMAPPLLRLAMSRVDHAVEEDQRAELDNEWQALPLKGNRA